MPGDTEGPEDKENSGMQSRSAVGIALLALIVAVVAFILTVLLWVDPNISPNARKQHGGAPQSGSGSGSGSNSGGMGQNKDAIDNRIYLFTMGSNWAPYGYVNDQGGQEGFMPSLLEKLCKHANKRCKVLISPYNLDFDAKLQYGPGLHGRFFDASAGWANTIERKGVYDFNGGFANAPNNYLYKKAGATVSLTSSSKVGFREFYYSSASCLKKSQSVFDKSNSMNYADWTTLAAKLADGTVDLAFAPDGSLGAGVEKVGSAMKCGEYFAFMHRKDVEMKWLDMALKDMKNDGSFKNLCDQSWQGKKVPCS